MRTRVLLVAAVFLFAWHAGGQAGAQEVSLQTLQGALIETKTTYSGLSRSPKGTAPTTVVSSLRIKLGPGDAIDATLSRNVTANTPVGAKRGVLNRSVSGKIGTPNKSGGLDFLWVLEGSQLTFLRIMEVGSFKITIALAETGGTLTCKVDSPYIPEVGAGAGKDKSALFAGAKIEILNIKQVASTCKVSRNS